MPNAHSRTGQFRKVSQNLFRYSANKNYYAIYKVAGKKIWRSLETADRELAERRLKEELQKHGKVDQKDSKLSLSDLLKLYEASIQGLAEHTKATRRSILRVFTETWEHGFDVPVRSISTGQVKLWLGGQHARLKNSSYNEYVRFVRHLFALAVSHQAIAESPASAFKQLRIEKPIRLTPTWEQFKAIVSDIRTQPFSADAEDTADLVRFMGEAGVGTAECANLRGEHIDLDRGRILLYRSKTDRGYAIPAFPQALPLLEQFKNKGRLQAGQSVFRVRDPKRALAAACKRLGFPHFSPRSLRRCFITRAIEMGVDFKTLASWQGHQDGGVLIAKTYSYLRNEHSDQMAKKLA